MLHQEFPAEDVARALEQALAINTPTASVVRQFIPNQGQQPPPAVQTPASLSAFKVTAPDLALYDRLAKGVDR